MKDISFSKKFTVDPGNDYYTFQVKKRRSWWLLLLLLPLLLLIRCDRDLTVTVVDKETGEPVQEAAVTLAYTSHYLADMWHFLPDYDRNYEGVTDEDGIAEFKDLPCSVFSYIFYCMSRATVTASSPCHDTAVAEPLFHFSRRVTLELSARRDDMLITVIDLETGDRLPGAKVEVRAGERVDTAMTDAAGRVTITGVPVCSTIGLIKGSCYGYADTTVTSVPAANYMGRDTARLALRPLKEKFTFFVKDVETREPIPGARAVVTLSDPRSGARGSHTAVTNVDGRGQGLYDSGFVLAKVHITASKKHYNDSTLQGDYTVAEFIRQPDDNRTVWLRPLPFTVDYQVVDSATHEPVAGVETRVTVTDPAGNTETYTEITNRNGKFPVHAKPGSKVTVETRTPGYHDGRKEIPSFGESPETIEISPIITPVDVDMVLVIDDTSSMGGAIEMVKSHARSFYDDLNRVCIRERFRINSMRLKVVSYGDLSEHSLRVSPIFNMPSQSSAYQAFVSGITVNGGGDEPEDGLQALAEALSTPWSRGSVEKRNVVIVFTDASTHPVSPAEMNALRAKWIAIPAATRRLILFAPGSESWSTISATWPDVHHERGLLSTVLAGKGYNEVLDYICKSL